LPRRSVLTGGHETVGSALALIAKATQCGDEFCEETIPMAQLCRPVSFAVVLLAPVLAGCSSVNNPFTSSVSAVPPPAAPLVPPSVRAEDIVGRWGLASYHRDQDRTRTEAAAKSQCAQPYTIEASPAGGGVMMLGHDSPKVQDMTLKGSVEGKTYVGPTGDPAGGDDREVVSFDGRVMILKWVDPEVAGRYGTMVLVRCGAEGTESRTARVKKKSSAVPQ